MGVMFIISVNLVAFFQQVTCIRSCFKYGTELKFIFFCQLLSRSFHGLIHKPLEHFLGFAILSKRLEVSCEDFMFRFFQTKFRPLLNCVSEGIWWYDPEGEISYVTAHMQTIRAQACFKGAAYSQAPLGSSQGKPSVFCPNRPLQFVTEQAQPCDARHLSCPAHCGNVYAQDQMHPPCLYVCVFRNH